MKTRNIAVTAVEGGWSLACDAGLEPVVFLSGARAEAHARALASRLSEAGDEVRVTVSDRSHSLVGSMLYLSGDVA